MLALLFLALLGVAAAIEPPGDSICNPPPDYCIANPKAFELIVLRTHHAGWIYVDITQEDLLVTYDVSGFAPDCDWKLVDMQLWVSTDFDTVPTNGMGIPLPGQFPLKKSVNCTAEVYTFTIPLVDIFPTINGHPRIACDDIVWFSAHANLICRNPDDATIDCEPAWGNGTHFVEQTPTSDWSMYNYVQILCDDDCTPPDDRTVCATSYAAATDNCVPISAHCFSEIGSTQWGFFNEIDDLGHFTLDIYMGGVDCAHNGSVVGQVYVDFTEMSIKIRFVTNDGFYLTETDVYVGKNAPTHSSGHFTVEHEGINNRIDEYIITSITERGVICTREDDGSVKCDVFFLIAHAIVCEGELVETVPIPNDIPGSL